MKLPPLKPGVTPFIVWLTVAGGLLYTALSVLTLLEVAWGAGAVVFLGVLFRAIQSHLSKPQDASADDDDDLPPGAAA